MKKTFSHRYLRLALASLCLFASQYGYATKMAPQTLAKLKSDSHTVALVKIEATATTNKSFRLLHTLTPAPLIQHKARILKQFKGPSTNKTISFMNLQGLSVGKQYLVFLTTTKDNHLIVSLLGHGTARIAYISMKSELTEAARVPAYIKLPASIKTKPGKTLRDEQISYDWVRLDDFIRELEK